MDYISVHWHRIGRVLRPVLFLVALVGLAAMPYQIVAARPARLESPAARKVLVDSHDSALRAELARSGSKLLVDYGAFSLWRVSDGQRLNYRPGSCEFGAGIGSAKGCVRSVGRLTGRNDQYAEQNRPPLRPIRCR